MSSGIHVKNTLIKCNQFIHLPTRGVMLKYIISSPDDKSDIYCYAILHIWPNEGEDDGSEEGVRSAIWR